MADKADAMKDKAGSYGSGDVEKAGMEKVDAMKDKAGSYGSGDVEKAGMEKVDAMVDKADAMKDKATDAVKDKSYGSGE